MDSNFKILTAYSSEESEDESMQEEGKTSAEHHRRHRAESSSSSKKQKRAETIVQSHNPSSVAAGEEFPGEEIRDPRQGSDWTFDEDDIEFHNQQDDACEEGGSSNLKEPPPPARPEDFKYSLSPSSRRSISHRPHHAYTPTPSVVNRTQKSNHPLGSLVSSYADMNDEDEDQSIEVNHQSVDDGSGGNDSSPAVPRKENHSTERIEVKTTENSPQSTFADELLSHALQDLKGDSPQVISSPKSQDQDILDFPMEPQIPCPSSILSVFRKHLTRKYYGADYNAQIQMLKEFQNPSIYAKLVDMFKIDELGTSCPRHCFNPYGFRKTDFYKHLSDAQNKYMEALKAKNEEKEKTSSTNIAAEPKAAVPSVPAKRSKWDNPSASKML